MPVGMQQATDVKINDQGYMLARQRGSPGYKRESIADTPKRLSWTRTLDEIRYGELPDEIEHPDVFDDWSGGFGHAYRHPNTRNTYHWASGFDARFERQLVHCQALYVGVADLGASLIMINGFVDFAAGAAAAEINRIGGGSTIVFGSKFFAQWTPSDVAKGRDFLTTTDLPSYVRNPVLYGSFLYVPVVEATQFTRINFALSVMNSDTHGLPGRAFAVAGDRLWRAHGPSRGDAQYIQSIGPGQDPTVTGNWSATLTIGNGNEIITDMIALGEQLYLGAPDGLYAGDRSGTFYNVLTDIVHERHIDNCRDLGIHNGRVIAPHVGGIFAYQPSEFSAIRGRSTEIGPNHLSNRGPVTGRVRCVHPYGPWLFAGLWTGSQSYLLAGYEKEEGAYVWHTQQQLPGVTKINRLHVDSITTSSGGVRILPNRFWIATDASIEITGTSQLMMFPIPRGHGNPLQPDPVFTANYIGSARIDLPFDDSMTPGTPKLYKKCEVWADNLLSGAQYCNVYYTVDQGSRTLLGYAASSPYTELYFPTSDGAGFVTGQALALSVESFTASANTTPIYRAFVVRTELLPGSIDVVTLQIRIADDLRDRLGSPLPTGKYMLETLRALGKKGQAPIVFEDPTGGRNMAKLLAGVNEVATWQAGSDYPEIVAEAKLAITTMTTG